MSVFRNLYYHLVYALRGVRVFALVGGSGTGKSFRAKLVAEKHGIDIIVDDGKSGNTLDREGFRELHRMLRTVENFIRRRIGSVVWCTGIATC